MESKLQWIIARVIALHRCAKAPRLLFMDVGNLWKRFAAARHLYTILLKKGLGTMFWQPVNT